MKKYFAIFIITLTLILTIQNSNAVQVYFGLRIDNLTDDLESGCAGETGYGSSGRIRAFASILPTYPIYFNLSKVSDGSTIWEGDEQDDLDYEIGDTIYLPDAVDLTIGEDYNFFFDIDAIKVYMPLPNYGASFTESPDDNYYITGSTANLASGFNSVADSCAYSGGYGGGTIRLIVYDDRTLTDGMKIGTVANNDFKIDDKYAGLSGPTIGNFNIAFTMS